MALVPHRQRDFQLAPPATWVGALSNRPAGAPVKGSIGQRKAVRLSIPRPRDIMLACAQRQWLHTTYTGLPTSSGTVVPLNDLNQGTGVSQRQGNQVRFLELEYCAYVQSLCTSGADAIRFVILQDHQPEGAVPTVAALLCAATTNSCFNPDLVGNQDQPRFKVLSNHFFTYNNPGPFTSVQTYNSPPITGRVKLNFTSTYVGNAGTSADLQTNGLYFLAITNTSNGTLVGDFCLKFLRM